METSKKITIEAMESDYTLGKPRKKDIWIFVNQRKQLTDQKMILLLFSLSHSAIFGVDFGSEYIKIGMALPGKSVHIALNMQSKRLSPSYFSFWNNTDPKNSQTGGHWTLDELSNFSWSFLDAAKSHAMRFPHNAAKGFLPIMDLRNGFTGREVLALMLRHLLTTVDEGKWKADGSSIVFTVEPRLSREERIAIAEAASLINLSIAAIIESPTAAATVYALEKTIMFKDGRKIVTFVDIGATHTWAAIFEFFPAKTKYGVPTVNELSVDFNYSLGGNLMDIQLANYLIQKFEEEFKVKIQDEKTRRQFIEESRRAKEILTLNKDVTVRMEDVLGDYSFVYSLKRTEFETLIEDWNDSISNLMDGVIKKAGLNITNVDYVELLGGATRVPFVKHAMMNHMGMSKLNRTLNSDEAIALGATYVCASKSTSFLMKPVKIAPFTGINVTIMLGRRYLPIFNETSRINETYTINLTVGELETIFLAANDNPVTAFDIKVPENVTENETVKVVFGFDDFSMPNVLDVTYNKTRIDVVHRRAPWMMSRENFTESAMLIAKMDSIMRERHLAEKITNDYESFIYRIKDKLEYDTTFKRVMKDEEKVNITQALEEHQNWLFSQNNVQPNITVYEMRLEDLKGIASPVESRAYELVHRPAAIDHLNATLTQINTSIYLDWPVTKPWLNGTLIEPFILAFNYTRDYFEDIIAQQENLTDKDDPIATVNAINEKAKYIEQQYNRYKYMSEPTPTPTPSPTPTPTLPPGTTEDPFPKIQKVPKNLDNLNMNESIDYTGVENNEL